MHGLTQRQIDALLKVMARCEVFIAHLAMTEHRPEDGEACLHCRAGKVLDVCRKIVRESAPANEPSGISG